LLRLLLRRRKPPGHTFFGSALPGAVILSLLLILLAACQAEPNDRLPPAPAAAVIQPSPTAPPPVLVTVSPNLEQQTFSALSSSELNATATTVAQQQEIAIAATEPTEPPTVPTATSTPEPTYTPPALPRTPDWEHYWLRRPVPEGSTVWTDKAYPYGSTRGGELRAHHGVEFNVPAGTEILAAASGTIVVAGTDDLERFGAQNDFYGKLVVLQHDTGLGDEYVYTLYGHLSDILVQVGEKVNARDVIALSGASGVADGPHLHFEVRLGSIDYESTRNPLLWLYPFPDRGVVAGLVTYPDGSPAPNVPLTLRRIDAPSPYAATTSYADSSVNPDDVWGENFAFDDIYAGYYELTAGTGENKVKEEMWVHPYQTSFVEITLDQQ
jgi:murein DD-endopeptidase MepM/ murein hydrolase activator NlpD